MRSLFGFVLCVQLASCAAATAAEAARKPPKQEEPAALEVDLREAPRRLLHVRMTLPAQGGAMGLVYPKWIPGEHGPTGPVIDVATLRIRAGDKLLAWRRDDVDMYRLQVAVPAGATRLELSFDFISPPPGDPGFSSGASMTQELAMLSWNQVLMAPEGTAPRDFAFHPSVILPAGWSEATALEEESRAGDKVSFKPVSMEQLIDSPVLAGAHLSLTPLGENHGAPVSIAVAAESAAETVIGPKELHGLKRLVAEEASLFGARHFHHYTFLLTLSDRVAHFGLEHHQSSDDRLAARTLLDPELSLAGMGLFGHESVHSWNGKYRRPIGLATPDYQTPMRGELLWIYEGLTEYLGDVLTARAGFVDPEEAREDFARAALKMRQARGRTTRPLEDTAIAAQLFYPSRDDWAGLRRSVDFYLEGQLIWLEADVRIRAKTHGARSLDDFCKLFFGGENSGPRVVPYALADVVTALNQISPDDWDAFFQKRIREVSDDAPLDGLTRAGWRLGASNEAGALWKADDKDRKTVDLRPSIGLILEGEQNNIQDIVPGSAADKAGLAPGMKVIAVNGHKYSAEGLATAIETSAATPGPIVLLVENADTYTSLSVDYRGGLNFPRLERIEGTPDLLSKILAPTAK